MLDFVTSVVCTSHVLGLWSGFACRFHGKEFWDRYTRNKISNHVIRYVNSETVIFSAGTFAVVSLMVGKVVEQSDCAELHTHTPSNLTQDNSSSTAAEVPTGGMSDLEKCQIGVAMAVSFVVGVIQVSCLYALAQLTYWCEDDGLLL